MGRGASSFRIAELLVRCACEWDEGGAVREEGTGVGELRCGLGFEVGGGGGGGVCGAPTTAGGVEGFEKCDWDEEAEAEAPLGEGEAGLRPGVGVAVAASEEGEEVASGKVALGRGDDISTLEKAGEEREGLVARGERRLVEALEGEGFA